MKLTRFFTRSNGQGKSGKNAQNGANKATAPGEAPPPAYVSGHDNHGQAHIDTQAASGHARYASSPYLSVIQALQNEPATKRTPAFGIRFFGKKPTATGPDSLRPYALYELGFARDPKRAAKIAKGLIKVGVFDTTGALLRRDAMPDRVVERLRDSRFSGIKKLTKQEAEGVRVYLTGHFENLQLLGQDVTLLPKHLRPDWLFFANLVPNKQDSHILMSAMQEHRVLDQQFLPIDGGVKYERFANDLFAHYAGSDPQFIDEHKDSLNNMVQTVRELLFPLPTYEKAPTYKP